MGSAGFQGQLGKLLPRAYSDPMVSKFNLEDKAPDVPPGLDLIDSRDDGWS